MHQAPKSDRFSADSSLFHSIRRPAMQGIPNRRKTFGGFPPADSHGGLRMLCHSARILCGLNGLPLTISVVLSNSVTEVKEEKPEAPKEAPEKPKRAPPAKTPTKPLPELMAEEVIPPLRAILQADKELSDLELSFHDNQLEGSFVKNGVPYTFWAFFPSGGLIGLKGFSLSSYGSGPSTVEPFLVDEKKITAKHVIFWVEKRLAAQGILPVWKE
ncbi:hypothetical protein EJ110_NYTH31606 [Nymphaea thermarum]|nr:hypothetical protein EJ110_NYTH31606 [Nymphaea thermarum]